MFTRKALRITIALLGAAILLMIIPLLVSGSPPAQVPTAQVEIQDSAEISDIVGVYFDADRGEIVILGGYDPNYPAMSRDYIRENLAIAMRALYDGGSTPWPGMTIEFGPKPGPDLLPVFYYGLITDTTMGRAMFQTDRLLKVYSLGEDNLNPGIPYASNVPDYMSIPDRLVALHDTYTGTVSPQRFFFEPGITFRLNNDESGGVFSNTQAVLDWAYIPEDTPYTSTNSTLAAQGFVDHFNTHYDEFAQEQWDWDETALKELVQLYKLDAIAKWIHEKGIENSLPGANSNSASFCSIGHTETPTYTPGITATRSFTVSLGGGSYYTQYIYIYGGVGTQIHPTYVADPMTHEIVNQAKSARNVGQDAWPFDISEDFCPTGIDEIDIACCPEPSNTLWAMTFKLADLLLQNGGFEDDPPGSSWAQYSSHGFQLIDPAAAHSGDMGVWFGGYPDELAYLYQDISIPPEGRVQVSYWWGIVTQTASLSLDNRRSPDTLLITSEARKDPSGSLKETGILAANDFLYVEVLDTNNNLLATLETLSNENPTGVWYSSSWDLSAYAGQTIRLRFRCVIDNQNPLTHFYLDDVNLESSDCAAPAVSEVSISPAPPLGKVTAQFEITFSEEMYRFLTPTVTIGLSAPYDAYTLTPLTGSGYTNGFSNSDPTKWYGTYTFDASMSSGVYHLRIGGAEDTWHNTLSTDTSHTFQVEISLSEGPVFAEPIFPSKVSPTQPITVQVDISDASTGGHGVKQATLYYGYSSPYNQYSTSGTGPGGLGDGRWAFAIPAQGEANADKTLYFYIVAWDNDVPQSSSVLNNSGQNYAVAITQHKLYLPVVMKNR